MSSVPTLHNRTIEWRLRQVMEQAGIATAVELHRRLKLTDPDAINFSRLAQIVDNAPLRISTRTLLALCVTLNCEISDIIRISTPT